MKIGVSMYGVSAVQWLCVMCGWMWTYDLQQLPNSIFTRFHSGPRTSTAPNQTPILTCFRVYAYFSAPLTLLPSPPSISFQVTATHPHSSLRFIFYKTIIQIKLLLNVIYTFKSQDTVITPYCLLDNQLLLIIY